jgi:hypothetical protein
LSVSSLARSLPGRQDMLIDIRQVIAPTELNKFNWTESR